MRFMPDGKFQPNRDQIIRKALDARHQASFVITRAKAVDPDDEASRTVEIICATDKPITHFLWSKWDYVDISIVMEKSAMRADRFENGAAFLMDHNTRDQRGVIESFSLKNGELRAVVRMSKSERGEELYQDILDGIRQQISLGFMIHKLTLVEERESEPDLYEARDWEPYEASSVAVAADLDAKVMRAIAARRDGLTNCPDCSETLRECICENSQILNATQTRAHSTNGEKTMPDKELNAGTDPVVDTRTPEQIATQREKDLIAWAGIFDKYGFSGSDIARDMLAQSKDTSQDDIRLAILEARKASDGTVKVPNESPTSIAARAGVKTELARSLPRYGKLQAFQGDGAEERAYRFGQFILGGPLGLAKGRAFCEQNGIKLERAQSEGVNEKGGYFVPEDFGNDIIDLIEKYGVFRSNAKIRPMTRDTASDPRITGELEAFFVGESAAGTESDFETDRVSLTAKKLMTLVTFSSEVSEDAAISIGDEIAMLSARAFAKKEDECGFNGEGAATHGGIVGVREKLKGLSGTVANIAGLQVGTGNAYSELVLADFRGVVAKLPEYADENAAWYVHRSFYWNVMVAALLAGGGVTAAEIENTRNKNFLGYPVRFSQVMPKTEANSQVCALFGDLAMGAKLGDRRQYTVALSEHVRFTADDTVFKATSRFDINVHSVGNASATAADRVPGPIVGLITAAA